MALVAGSVNVADNFEVSADGLAAYLWITEWSEKVQQAHAAIVAKYEATGKESFGLQLKLAAMRSIALRCNKLATGIAEWILQNAEITVTIGTGDAGLQGMPQNKKEDEPTKAPLEPKTLIGHLE